MQLWLEMCIVSEIYALHYSTKPQDYTKYIISIKRILVISLCSQPLPYQQQRTTMINSVFLLLFKQMCTKIDVDDKKLFVRESIIKSITKSKSFPQLVRACGDQSQVFRSLGGGDQHKQIVCNINFGKICSGK